MYKSRGSGLVPSCYGTRLHVVAGPTGSVSIGHRKCYHRFPTRVIPPAFDAADSMQRMQRVLCLFALALVPLPVQADDLAGSEVLAPIPQFVALRPLLAAHCFDCHGPDLQEGGVRFDTIAPEIVDRHRPLWKRAAARIAAGEMPPPDAAVPLSATEQATVLAWLNQTVARVNCGPPEGRDPGPAPLRRLTATEYERTVRDLLGVQFDPRKVGLKDDESGFGNTAATLALSPTEFEKFLAAADAVLEQFFDHKHAAARDKLLGPAPITAEGERAAARQSLATLLRRAYRRPVEPSEIERYLTLYDRAAAQGQPVQGRLRAMLKPLLVSPYFLYRVEAHRPAMADATGVPVSDHELAVRLSYFLWASLPDAELDALADAGTLSDPAVLDAQVSRMLADPKAEALTDIFAARWLQLSKLDAARPTTEFFPTFNGNLKRAMRDEVLTFFNHLRTTDGSLLDLLDADYTFVNTDLAKHYGLRPVDGRGMQRVPLPPELHRGGLLGMAGVLTLTSHTFRTSPTQRGKYVLEVVLGDPPPPPPPDAGMLKDDNGKHRKAPASFREQLALHATQASCAGCHREIDPLGFALDNFDPIGSWRDSTADQPLDVTGTLPGGTQFSGAAGLKTVLLARQDQFARNLAEQMLIYALGRPLDWYDECTVREVTAELQQSEHRLSALVRGVVRSTAFRYQRAGE